MWVLERNNKLLSGLFARDLEFKATHPRDAYICDVYQVARDMADKHDAILREVYKPRAPFGDYEFKLISDVYRVELHLKTGGYQLLSTGARSRTTWSKATAKKHANDVNKLIAAGRHPWVTFWCARVHEAQEVDYE